VPKLPVAEARITVNGVAGDRLRIGDTVLLEMLSYTSPCKYNAQWFANGEFSRISQKLHPGWSRLYARVLAEGVVRTGDRVTVERQA